MKSMKFPRSWYEVIVPKNRENSPRLRTIHFMKRPVAGVLEL